MKVVHIEAGRHLYGGARQAAYLIAELARRGVSNALVCAPGAAIAEQVAGRAEIAEIPMAGDLDLSLVPRLRSLLAKLDPDLVHVHSRRGADLYAGIAAGVAAGGSRPAVLTRRVDSAEWAPWARFKYARYAAVVAISRAVERALLHAGVPRERVRLVPSGVDTERFRPDASARARLRAAFSLPGDSFVAGVVAQLIPRKGHGMLLDLLPDVAARHPRFVVICFGRGPGSERLAREIAARRLERRVVLAGFRDDLPALLPGLDALLHPATAEGLGVAVLEALAAGVPVAASAVGGIVDVIEPGAHGLLVPHDDRAAWIEAIDSIVCDSALRTRLAASGRARVEAEFSARRMAEGNLAVYEAVLRGRGTARGHGKSASEPETLSSAEIGRRP
ncbi:MAG TPA: glycosyltransferase family 4 protein [Gammaproteobacteria bacterium]|nr:glycosyltransferase family 4 protein [Gammaproteobacteria bacterium]